MPVIGVDIGGTKVAAAVVNAEGNVVDTVREPTPSLGGEAVLDTVAALVSRLRGQHDVHAVGVGSPGIVEQDRGVVLSATGIVKGWEGTAVRDGLLRRAGLPVAVDNDVRVMALGSMAAYRSTSDALYVSVGTGIGGAVLREGRLVRGARGSAGEIAHLLVPAEGPIPCGCGRRDHVEAVAAGPAMAAGYAARCGLPYVPRLPEVVRRMGDGDDAARSAVTGAARILGRCLAGVVTAFDIDAVMLGGGAAQIGAEFLTPLAEALHGEVRPHGRELTVRPVEAGVDAPLLGAGILARQEITREAR